MNTMDQAQEQRHRTEQEEQHFTQPGEPEQGRVPVQEPDPMDTQRDFIREVEPGTWKWIFTLLTYILAFSLMYSSPGWDARAASVAEQPSAMIRDNHITIKVNNPVNCAVSVASTWPVAPVSMTTETVTATATEKFTETVTATTTEKTTATVTEVRIPPSVTEHHLHINPGCMSTRIGNRIWSGFFGKGEDVEVLIGRLMEESCG